MMGVLTQPSRKTDVRNATFADPDLTTFCGLDELGLVVVGQRVESDRACWRAGSFSRIRGVTAAVVRGSSGAAWSAGWLTNLWGGDRQGWMEVRICRYRCSECGYVWRQITTPAPAPGAAGETVSSWSAVGVGSHRVSTPDRRPSRRRFGVAWTTANQAVLGEGARVLIVDPGRFDGVKSYASMSTCGDTPAAVTSSSP